MLLGVATILGAVALISAIARNSIVRLFETHSATISQVSRILDGVAGATLTTIAVIELSA